MSFDGLGETVERNGSDEGGVSYSLTAGHESVQVVWSVEPGWVHPWVHYRLHLPGEPWDGVEAAEGQSPLKNLENGRMELSGIPNGVLVYVTVSAENQAGERMLPPYGVVEPARRLGEKVWIPAGGFPMGQAEGGASEGESPERWVYTDGFWMDQYPATNDEFRACVQEGVCGLPAQDWGYLPGLVWIPNYFTNPLYGRHPVSFLEFQEAKDFCEWRGMRLPTEAEWEKAARGSSTNPAYPWGEDPPTCEMANYSEEGLFCEGGPLPVDSFSANISPYGVREMGGNVWEWTGDWYDATYYSWGECVNPAGPETGSVRVLRGGAWYYPVDALSVTYRNTWEPTFVFVGNYFGDYRGFGVRCVEPAPEVPCEGNGTLCDQSTFCAAQVTPPPADGEGSEDSSGEAGESDGFQVDTSVETDSSGGADAESDGGAVEPDGDSMIGGEDSGGDAEDGEVEPEPCIHPQDEPVKNEFLCFDPIPGFCPSGWTAGCEVKACHCSIGKTADPGECGEGLMTIVAGWRDKEKTFTPFAPEEPMEICEGFQGGVHLAAVFHVDAPQMVGEFFYADLVATMRIGDMVVGSFDEVNVKLERTETGLFESKLEQVRFEGCLGDAYAGETVELDVLVRDTDGNFGWNTVTIPLQNEVEGPYLDVAFVNPC